MKRLTRLFPPLLAFSAGAAAMTLPLQLAHADPVVKFTPTGIEVGWQGWLMAFVVVVGSALSILDTVLVALKRIAPMTKTTIDDRARDVVQVVDDAAHAKLDALLKVVNGLVPATGVPAATSDKPALTIAPPPRDSQAGRSLVGMMAALSFCGVVGFAIACTATQARQTAATGVVAALDCEAAHLDPQALADAKTFAMLEVQRWIAGGAAPSSDQIRADLAPIKSDLGRCAIAGALAAVAALTRSAPGEAVSALTAAGADPVQTRAAFAVAARQVGWPAVRLPGGEVL